MGTINEQVTAPVAQVMDGTNSVVLRLYAVGGRESVERPLSEEAALEIAEQLQDAVLARAERERKLRAHRAGFDVDVVDEEMGQ